MVREYLTSAQLAKHLGCHVTSIRRRAPARVKIAGRRGYLPGDFRRWPHVSSGWTETVYLSTFEVAERVGVEPSTVFRAVKRRDLLPAVRVGSTLGFEVETVEAWQNARS